MEPILAICRAQFVTTALKVRVYPDVGLSAGRSGFHLIINHIGEPKLTLDRHSCYLHQLPARAGLKHSMMDALSTLNSEITSLNTSNTPKHSQS